MSRATHTPGPWMVGHFADDDHSCNCTGILSQCYMGAIAQIRIDNELPIAEGGNDSPPLEEAKANGRLIAAAPDLLAASQLALHIAEAWAHEQLDGTRLLSGALAELEPVRAAIAKATGA